MNAAERLAGGEHVSLGIMNASQESRQESFSKPFPCSAVSLRGLRKLIDGQDWGNT
jgi:hypothetical protein